MNDTFLHNRLHSLGTAQSTNTTLICSRVVHVDVSDNELRVHCIGNVDADLLVSDMAVFVLKRDVIDRVK